MRPKFSLSGLLMKLGKSRFFIISAIVHLAIVFIFGGTILFRAATEPTGDFDAGDAGGFVQPQAQNAAPPPTDSAPQQTTFTVSAPTAPAGPSLTAITSINPTATSFSVASAPTQIMTSVNTLSTNMPSAASAPSFSGDMSRAQVQGVAGFTSGWSKGGGSERGKSLRERQFEFTAYVAQYEGGDWNSTVQRDSSGKIVSGSLPNLIYYITKRSRDKIKANPDPVPLKLSDRDKIMATKPPFIFFTGHRDFTLTETEVQNLREYLQLGGAIWGDASLPGLRSRFDLAFRREMRKVIPDADKKFETLPPNHPIFGQSYWPEVREVPAGLNYYREPVEALRIYGEIAILYTANDYGDMWQVGLNEQDQLDTRRSEGGHYVAMNEQIYQRRDIYFRNLEIPALVRSYHFGTNVILHLLTRWENKVANAPRL